MNAFVHGDTRFAELEEFPDLVVQRPNFTQFASGIVISAALVCPISDRAD